MLVGPLDRLYQDQYGMDMHHYPSDLGSSRKGHWVTFSIGVPKKSSYSNESSSSVDSSGMLKNIIDSASSLIGSTAEAFLDPNSDFTPLNLISSGVTKTWNFISTPPAVTQVASISLYTPDTISISQHMSYTHTSLTNSMGALGQAAAVASAVDANDGGGQTIQNLGMELGAAKFGGKNAQDISGIGLNTQGMAINPQMEVLFTQIEFRTFQFDFLFTPRNQQETASIRNIIQMFKMHAAPEIDSASGGRYFIVPSRFDINFYKDGKINTNIHKLAPAVLTAIVTDYAPQGWVTHEDGMPVQTRLTLQFQEIEILDKNKIREQGY
jgi:hypothetical protein